MVQQASTPCRATLSTWDGKTPKDTRTALQRSEMARYIREFHKRHPKVRIVGHRDLNRAKACPSFDVSAWLKVIL